MTGAVLPLGSDCVLPYEEIEIKAGKAKINDVITVKAGVNIHQQAREKYPMFKMNLLLLETYLQRAKFMEKMF